MEDLFLYNKIVHVIMSNPPLKYMTNDRNCLQCSLLLQFTELCMGGSKGFHKALLRYEEWFINQSASKLNKVQLCMELFMPL